jgi:hypothetical protein
MLTTARRPCQPGCRTLNRPRTCMHACCAGLWSAQNMRLPDQPMPARGSVLKRGCLHDTSSCRRTSRLSAETDRQPVMARSSNPGYFRVGEWQRTATRMTGGMRIPEADDTAEHEHTAMPSRPWTSLPDPCPRRYMTPGLLHNSRGCETLGGHQCKCRHSTKRPGIDRTMSLDGRLCWFQVD